MKNVLYYIYCNERKVSIMFILVAIIAIAIIAAIVVSSVTAVVGGIIDEEFGPE